MRRINSDTEMPSLSASVCKYAAWGLVKWRDRVNIAICTFYAPFWCLSSTQLLNQHIFATAMCVTENVRPRPSRIGLELGNAPVIRVFRFVRIGAALKIEYSRIAQHFGYRHRPAVPEIQHEIPG